MREKYAVVQDESLVKTSSAGGITCPSCGTTFERKPGVNVVVCPKCGTRPFEKAKEDDGGEG